MPHPQDVAVPSLPLSETLALAIKLGVANVDFEEQAEIDGFLHTFGNACYEAGRAAGRASAEPEGAQDTKRLDWLDAAAVDMLLEFGFEMEGGVYLRIDAPGHGGTDIREKNSARDLIDSAMVVVPC